ncbi:MAG: IgA Peptidase M64, partial [Bacteroidetes bacterium]|nr:IgA Peptidase M64 [Bacteroidota bacterium]
VNLLDAFDYGEYKMVVVDKQSSSPIYSRTYSSLFFEWQTTDEAKETQRSMCESLVMPYPKNAAVIEIHCRNKKGIFEKKFCYDFSPGNYFVKKERRLVFPSFDVQISGDPAKKIDIVILPEGYTKNQMNKFEEDCKKFAQSLFSYEPYKRYAKSFNIRGVKAISEESGADIPADGIWKKTVMDFTYYTFDSERYLMSADNKKVRDVAANAPYDQIYVLVNTEKYGGGAIYNFYCATVVNNPMANQIFIHEFGHGFAGLADEYYTSETSYIDFYDLETEPWEPNLTTLVDFDKKWKHLVSSATPIPTPAEAIYIGKTGVFEGGGYVAKGVYRPSYDCLMHSFNNKLFCAACTEAIEKMIRFYSD